MDTNLWIGVLAGVAGTFLVLGGLAAVTATATGMGPMGMGEMGSMMDQCPQMMDDHGHEHGEGEGHGNGTGEAARTNAMAPSPPDRPVPPSTSLSPQAASA